MDITKVHHYANPYGLIKPVNTKPLAERKQLDDLKAMRELRIRKGVNNNGV